MANTEKNKKEKKVTPDKFKVGDKVKHPKYGKGFLHQVDESCGQFHYDFHFEDGTLIWMGKKDAEKDCVLL